jgi:hypothetical protein
LKEGESDGDSLNLRNYLENGEEKGKIDDDKSKESKPESEIVKN